MTNQPPRRHRRPLVTIHESPQLPRELWERFKAETQRRGETWIAVLRRAIEQYLDRKESGR